MLTRNSSSGAYSREVGAKESEEAAPARELTCDGCGAALTEEDFVAAETIAVPSATDSLARAEWAGSDHDCGRAGIKNSAVGE